jgi:hypothetical protein
MEQQKKVKIGLYIFGVICFGLAAYLGFFFWEKKEPPKSVVERKLEISAGEIYIYGAGQDFIIYSSQKAYPIFKQALLDTIFAINGVAFNGRIFPEDVPGGKDAGGQPGLNQIKDKYVGLGAFLGTEQNLLTSYKTDSPAANGKIGANGYLYIPADQVVIILSGEYKGLVFTRNSYQKREWVAWKTDRAKYMKLVDLVTVGSQKYEK